MNKSEKHAGIVRLFREIWQRLCQIVKINAKNMQKNVPKMRKDD